VGHRRATGDRLSRAAIDRSSVEFEGPIPDQCRFGDAEPTARRERSANGHANVGIAFRIGGFLKALGQPGAKHAGPARPTMESPLDGAVPPLLAHDRRNGALPTT